MYPPRIFPVRFGSLPTVDSKADILTKQTKQADLEILSLPIEIAIMQAISASQRRLSASKDLRDTCVVDHFWAPKLEETRSKCWKILHQAGKNEESSDNAPPCFCRTIEPRQIDTTTF
jgi:hypothetical protein